MRLSEVYLSVQGEGPNVGFPTVFVRFGGCNLRCPLWPCDTPYAIFPEYRKEWLSQDYVEVFDRIMAAGDSMAYFNVCLTGGEPFLQNHDQLGRLVDMLRASLRVKKIEAFSNGALKYPDWQTPFRFEGRDPIDVVMDWKLPGSGEGDWSETRFNNILDMAPENLSVKFTIANKEDYLTAKRWYVDYLVSKGYKIYAGVVWGQLENKELVDWILADGLPWHLNVQVHNHVWDRSQRGI